MDENSENAEAAQALPEPEASAPQRGRSGKRIVALLVVLLLLAALVVAGGYGWQRWRQQDARLQQAGQTGAQQRQALARLDDRIDALASKLDEQGNTMQALGATLSQRADQGAAMGDRLQGLSQRTDQLETAVSRLTQQQISGAERMRLEDVAMLLMQAGQRYRLLHDGGGALAALNLARDELAAADDPAFHGVSRTLDDEIGALAATRPDARQDWLNQLSALRSQWQDLPPRPLDRPAQTAPEGTWDRIWNAVSTLVVVHREQGEGSVSLADARLARQVAAIDLAQAQAALLADDPAGARDSIERVRQALERYFDADSPAVKRAAERLQQLDGQLADAASQDVQLGAALTALRNQLQVRQMNAAPVLTSPASAGTAARP